MVPLFLAEPARILVASALTAVLAVAAISDVRDRRIPNWSVLSVLGLFLLWTVAGGGVGLVAALEAAGIAAAVTVTLYAFRIVGAGDSKLFTVVALFTGLTYLPLFALATVLAGGVIAAVSLVSRPTRALVMFQMRGKGDFGRGVPYGVAIALGGALAVWWLLSGVPAPFVVV
ncbi:A24 family peptidase [Phenylobacterium sp.]|jgi:prepilin peptidase CpaA|uniref:A24 family peptidase n=1 Tax=Phenylobacterium sp. TaxID=1871053 RepID=UPI002F4129A5